MNIGSIEKDFILAALISILAINVISCKKTDTPFCDIDSTQAEIPYGLTLNLQPLDGFAQKQAEQLKLELEKSLLPIIHEVHIQVEDSKTTPDSCLYKPRNRYWAGKILGFLKHEAPDIVTIGVTDKDISATVHGKHNYGIMGYSLRPGNVCVVSTYRCKRKGDLYKVVIHEFLHSRGLPHCKADNPKCIMQDAHGRNTFYMKHGICKSCQKELGNL